MNFVTLNFIIFSSITIFVYWISKESFKTPILLVASYVFYAFWDWRFMSLLFFLTLSNYYLAQKISHQESKTIKQKLLFLCLLLNFTVLAIFKYLGFFSENLNQALKFIGLESIIPSTSILLPLGLSFFIFQISSYSIDVFRGKVNSQVSLLNFATFVVYFPHMAAGPIMPAHVLIPQIESKKVKPDFNLVQSALLLIAVGLFRKIVIADTLAPMVNRVFGSPGSFDWKSLIIATLGFGLQIYGDFAGYSAIARGVSRLFGIEMMVNFKQPYLATSITDFWRRWHISLSSWFRDYLYIPLGGNKQGRNRTNLNLLIVMVIAGLWHGAAFGFVLWGFLHGVYLIIDKYLSNVKKITNSFSPLNIFFGWLITQIAIFTAWLFFRNPNISDSIQIVRSMIMQQAGIFEPSDAILVICALSVSFATDYLERYVSAKIEKSSVILKGAIFGGALTIVFVMKSSTVVPFIYFGF